MVAKAIIAVSMAAVAVQAKVIEHWWNISYAQANPDGVSGSTSRKKRWIVLPEAVLTFADV